MKTSNKLLVAAFALIIASLIFYDITLKESYLGGDYKRPFKDFTSLNFKNFNSIDLSASTAANIILEQGPFSEKIEPTAKRFVKVSQKAGTLLIEAAFPSNYENSRAAYVLIISCPNLVKVNTTARYFAKDQQIIDTIASPDFKWRPTIIRGFTLDSLSITEDYASTIILTGNHIRAVNAVIGLSKGSGSNMVILKDNQFKNVQLNILNKSQFQLHGAAITNFNYHLADSAKLIFNGTTKRLLI
jgi:hypothetical protein